MSRTLTAAPEPTGQARPAKLLLSIREAVAYSGIKRTMLYQLIATGQLKSKQVGPEGSKRKRRMIRRVDLEAFCKQ